MRPRLVASPPALLEHQGSTKLGHAGEEANEKNFPALPLHYRFLVDEDTRSSDRELPDRFGEPALLSLNLAFLHV